MITQIMRKFWFYNLKYVVQRKYVGFGNLSAIDIAKTARDMGCTQQEVIYHWMYQVALHREAIKKEIALRVKETILHHTRPQPLPLP